jgi:nitric oxide dioxygenase
MTPEQLELVRSSYAALGDERRAVARDFYKRLLAADPAVEALFGDDPEVMAAKFSDELAAIVEAIVSYDAFATRLQELAARHLGYGVQTRHYRLVGDALVAALAAALAPRWDETLDAAWRTAYNLVAEVMMAAAAQVSCSSPATRRPDP